jgi:hypothetical protein
VQEVDLVNSFTGGFVPHPLASNPTNNYGPQQTQQTVLAEAGAAYNPPQSPPTSHPTYNYGSDQLSNLNQLVDNSICGVPIASVGLIKGGSDYQRGDWPWLGAFIHDREFICGGSLSKSCSVQIEQRVRVRFETWLRKLYTKIPPLSDIVK